MFQAEVDAQVDVVSKQSKLVSFAVGLLVVALMTVGCSDKDSFTQTATTQIFEQSYNPPYLDILWMVDTRSGMAADRTNLITQATSFFQTLDSSTNDYQMGIVTADMQFAKGALQPTANPVILTKTLGTVAQRTQLFSNFFVNSINVTTGAADEGFASVLSALQGQFQPRTGVPLVLVFISDSDDQSPNSNSSGGSVSYYQQQYLTIKNNDPTLLKVYSINYEPLTAGQTVSTSTRCATLNNADIDNTTPGYFKNTYFNLANAVDGTTANDTANLCGNWASTIDLTGLKLKTLPSTFALSGNPQPSSILVQVFQGSTQATIPWTYDATSNSIVFTTAPPAGYDIQVTYDSN